MSVEWRCIFWGDAPHSLWLAPAPSPLSLSPGPEGRSEGTYCQRDTPSKPHSHRPAPCAAFNPQVEITPDALWRPSGTSGPFLNAGDKYDPAAAKVKQEPG